MIIRKNNIKSILSLENDGAKGDLGFSLVSRRWDPAIGQGDSMVSEHHQNTDHRDVNRRLSSDLKRSDSICFRLSGRLWKPMISGDWNAISAIIKARLLAYKGISFYNFLLMFIFSIEKIGRVTKLGSHIRVWKVGIRWGLDKGILRRRFLG